MAVIKTRLTSLPAKRRAQVLRMLLSPVLIYLVDLTAAFGSLDTRWRIALQLAMVIALYWWMRGQAIKYHILSAGINAERAAAQLLTRLPDSVTIFSDITLQAGRESAQIDHLLVTPTGIFVLEAKSWKGTLRGDGNLHSWTLHKSGRAGGRYHKSVPNPFGQLDRQVRVVGRLAGGTGKGIPVRGALFLPYTEAQIEISNLRHQIVLGEQVLRMVQSRPATLTRAELHRLVGLIDGEAKRLADGR